MKAKRLIALLLMIIMAVTPVVVVSAYEGDLAQTKAVGSFVPRLTAPSKSNKYYYSNLNLLYASGYGMPNCTAYAWGRAYEITGLKPSLCLNDADNWWQYNKDNKFYPYGQEPKEGAIACWNYTTGGGHVAVVEMIEDGVITFSNSAYGGKNFYLTYADVDAPNGGINYSTWVFKGYIYVTEGKSPEEYYQSLGGDVYTVDSYDGVNLRKGAGTSYKTLTAIPDGTQIVVTDTKKADGYTWGKTTYDGYKGWCVLDFTKLVYKQPEPTTAPPVTQVPTTQAPATVPETEPIETTEPIVSATYDEALPAATPDEIEPTEATGVTLPTISGTANDSTADEALFAGDVNGDGKISVTDVTLLQKHLAKVKEIEEDKLIFADVNYDDKISVADATLIQKKIAGLI